MCPIVCTHNTIDECRFHPEEIEIDRERDKQRKAFYWEERTAIDQFAEDATDSPKNRFVDRGETVESLFILFTRDQRLRRNSENRTAIRAPDTN